MRTLPMTLIQNFNISYDNLSSPSYFQNIKDFCQKFIQLTLSIIGLITIHITEILRLTLCRHCGR